MGRHKHKEIETGAEEEVETLRPEGKAEQTIERTLRSKWIGSFNVLIYLSMLCLAIKSDFATVATLSQTQQPN